MKHWKTHWLRATGDLDLYETRIAKGIRAANTAMARFVPLAPLDILVERGAEGTIAEIGMRARARRGSLVVLTVDPFNDQIDAALTSGAVARQVLRAAHLAMRLDGPGYGFTLGGAMVSEGLAAQFVRLALNTAPEPWDRPTPEMNSWWPDQRSLMTPKYDHGAWFEGSGNKPRWLGYALGTRLVENWLTSGASITPKRMIDIPAPKVLTVALAAELAS